MTIVHVWWCADLSKKDSGCLKLDQVSLPPLIDGESPRSILPYEFNTLEKLFGGSLEHIAEAMCSIYYLHVVRKEVKYSSCKNEEN